jgi:hypothetical protein
MLGLSWVVRWIDSDWIEGVYVDDEELLLSVAEGWSR